MSQAVQVQEVSNESRFELWLMDQVSSITERIERLEAKYTEEDDE